MDFKYVYKGYCCSHTTSGFYASNSFTTEEERTKFLKRVEGVYEIDTWERDYYTNDLEWLKKNNVPYRIAG